jgi:hypothetical protein
VTEGFSAESKLWVDAFPVTLQDTNYWFTVPGAGGTSQAILNFDASKPNVFYRLMHP